MGRVKKQRLVFKGIIEDDSILVGSHGNADIIIDGMVDLSGIIYCPKYTVTLIIKGSGRIAFRGKCNQLIIKKMEGGCVLNLADLTTRELRCESLKQQSVVIAGKTRLVSQAVLADDAELSLVERPLVISSQVSDQSRIIYRSPSEMIGSVS